MENKLITVVVPVYNMGKYLPKAIDCLLKQTYENYEIIIVDDGSTDGSSEVCDECAGLDARIRVVHKENGGLSSARNCGIDNANGEYIIFPDPDDYVEPNYLQALVDMTGDNELEISGHFVTEDGKDRPHNPHGEKQELDRKSALAAVMLSVAYCGFAWNKLYHLDIIKANDLRFDLELGMAQDLHFAFRYISLCSKISYNPTVQTYHYVQHAEGVTNLKAPLSKRKISGLKTYEKIADLAGDEYHEVRGLAYSTLFNMSMHFTYIYYEAGMCDAELMSKLKANMKLYKKYFFKYGGNSFTHKMLGRIALISPKLYHFTKKLLRGKL